MNCFVFSFYVVSGMIAGAVFAFLFIRMDKKWETCVLTGVGLPSFLVVLKGVNSYMGISNSNTSFYLNSAAYVISLFLTICIVMIITGYLIKHQTDVVKIRFLDILLGYNKCIEEYYDSRKEEMKKELNYDRLVKLKKETDESILLNSEKQRILNEQMQDSVVMSLPINSKMPIDNRFLACIPGYIANLTNFYISIENNTKMFCQKYNPEETNNLDFVLGYFSRICIDINTKLFGGSQENVRSHFRVKHGDNYVKFIAFQGSHKFHNDMTKIPVDSGLIWHSFENKCSLLKSENRNLHYNSKNDAYWKNYISFAIDDICEDNTPLFSAGISVNNEALYNDMLYFINFCQIERVISKCIAQFDSVCNIYEIVDSYCDEREKEQNVQ